MEAMRVAFLREKVIAGLCCLLALVACVLMWYEAGLDHAGRRLNVFGGPRSTPFWERRFPESNILFAGCAYGAMLLGLLGITAHRNTEEKEPEFLAGPVLMLAGFLLSLLIYQARTVNGVPLEVFQPGCYLALAANGGLALAGLLILFRAAWRRS